MEIDSFVVGEGGGIAPRWGGAALQWFFEANAAMYKLNLCRLQYSDGTFYNYAGERMEGIRHSDVRIFTATPGIVFT